MILAIDTDLFHAAELDYTCAKLLEDINKKIEGYQFALDKDGLEADYLDFYSELKRSPNFREHPAFPVLDQLFNGNRLARAIEIPSSCPEYMSCLVQACLPVEPELLGVAANSKRVGGLTVLLADPEIVHPKKRARKLFEESFARKILQQIPWAWVARASDVVNTDIPSPSPGIVQTESDRQSHKFELLCIMKIQELYQCLHVHIQTPKQVNQLAGQVDVYVYQRNGSPRKVWIGECKLRDDGNKDTWINAAEMHQLCRKLEAVTAFEKKSCMH